MENTSYKIKKNIIDYQVVLVINGYEFYSVKHFSTEKEAKTFIDTLKNVNY